MSSRHTNSGSNIKYVTIYSSICHVVPVASPKKLNDPIMILINSQTQYADAIYAPAEGLEEAAVNE